MADTFETLIPTLSDAELEVYLAHPERYKREAVEAALAELRRRGREPVALERFRPGPDPEEAPPPSLRRRRLVLAGMLVAGLGSALVLYLRASTEYDLHPEDSKTYLREMEVIGGKANLLGAQIVAWFGQGTHLAFAVAVLTLAAAGAYWYFLLERPSS